MQLSRLVCQSSFLASIIVLASILLIPSGAGAQPQNLTPEKRAEARAHLTNGMRKFNVAKFNEAAEEFVAAYEIAGDPSILYNIAQAYRLGEQNEKALFFYKTFLRQLDPKSSLRGEVEKRIGELTIAVEQAKHASTAPPTGTIKSDAIDSDNNGAPASHHRSSHEVAMTTHPAEHPRATEQHPAEQRHTEQTVRARPTPVPEKPAAPPPPALKYAGFALAGLAVAGVAVGAGMSGAAAHDSSLLEKASRDMSGFGPHLQSAQKNGQLYDTLSYVFYGVGGAAAVAAAVTLYFGLRQPSTTRAQIAPTVGPGSAGLVIEGSF